MLTLNKINKEIAAHGLKIELCKGKGYFYFWGEDVKHDSEGVYVYRLNELGMQDWLQSAFEVSLKC